MGSPATAAVLSRCPTAAGPTVSAQSSLSHHIAASTLSSACNPWGNEQQPHKRRGCLPDLRGCLQQIDGARDAASPSPRPSSPSAAPSAARALQSLLLLLRCPPDSQPVSHHEVLHECAVEQQREAATQLGAHLLQLMEPAAKDRLVAALSQTAEGTQLSISEEQHRSVVSLLLAVYREPPLLCEARADVNSAMQQRQVAAAIAAAVRRSEQAAEQSGLHTATAAVDRCLRCYEALLDIRRGVEEQRQRRSRRRQQGTQRQTACSTRPHSVPQHSVHC